MTELQGAIGKVQLKKLKTILSNNKIKYDILKKNILSFRKRDLPIYGKSNFDCFIFFVSKNSKKKIIEILNNFNIGTKNLPDAIKWHCAYYWKHIFTKKECLEVKFTYNLLKSTIAIPILFTKKKLIYKKIASKINNINV
jgi:8-amino-3,8-dideoxy-alpha-D-manno-octulosonate transaminase